MVPAGTIGYMIGRTSFVLTSGELYLSVLSTAAAAVVARLRRSGVIPSASPPVSTARRLTELPVGSSLGVVEQEQVMSAGCVLGGGPRWSWI